ncbi:hypothetical protein DFH08DRAFT_795997 [Mycena albidolilacea]|uniref:F-box domain-containing protein n=1 Tax=Mycena albidolilacea TaxID=1033008 RepID=A0AAD7F6A1_9AGAR|nr:hypothetical protein DFH08DRAFT_795997 [Mycena albidolilacea]
MTISHRPQISYIHRRQSLSRRKRASLLGLKDGSSVDSSCAGKLFGNGGTIFTAFPFELRAEVFKQYCGMYCDIGQVTEGPALLLRICRAWTELAIQVPELWSSFVLQWHIRGRPPPGPKKTRFLISALHAWIVRSRNLPLSFKFGYEVPLDSTCTALMQCILPSFPRWRDVTLKAPTEGLLPLWEGKPSRTTCLRTFTMETFGHSPVDLKDLRINWTQVTELDLFIIPIPTLDECLHILKDAVNLRRCSMNALCLLSSDELEPLSLPRLEYLRLRMYKPATSDSFAAPLLAFLHSLSLPGLQSLVIDWNLIQAPQWSNASSDRFVEFLEQLDGHLETLHLGLLPLDARQILRCLRATPSLRSLGLVLPTSEHDFIDFLDALTLHTGSNPGLLPILQSIQLKTDSEVFSNAALLRFIASRWKYQESPAVAGELESMDFVAPRRGAKYRAHRFEDEKVGRLQVAARLRLEFTMVQVLACFLEKDSYKQICFLNGDFPPDIRSLLVFG